MNTKLYSILLIAIGHFIAINAMEMSYSFIQKNGNGNEEGSESGNKKTHLSWYPELLYVCGTKEQQKQTTESIIGLLGHYESHAIAENMQRLENKEDIQKKQTFYNCHHQ